MEFGVNGVPLLRVRQHQGGVQETLPLTDLSIGAPSKAAVLAFHQAGLRANPALCLVQSESAGANNRETTSYSNRDGICCAMLHDLDGNRMQAVYPDPHPAGGNVKYSGSSLRETQSTQSEVGRILHWNYDVASSSPRTSRGSRISRHPQDTPKPLRRSLTHDTYPLPAEASREDPTTLSRQDSSAGGVNGTTMVGALLGVAAGAGLLYSAWNSREKTQDPAIEEISAPVLPRRSTLPEMPMGMNSRVHHLDQMSGIDDLAHREYVYAGSGRRSSRDDSKTRDLYAEAWAKPRSIENPWTQDAPASRAGTARTPPRTRAVDDNIDGRSRHSSRFNGGRTSEARARSAGPNARDFMLDYEDRPSRLGSRRGSVSGRSRSRNPDNDRESYASARTHKTSSTSRPPLSRPPPVEYETVIRSRAASRSSGMRTPRASPTEAPTGNSSRSTSYVSARNVPLPTSEISARHVPLPMSEVSARHVPLPRSEISARHIPLPMSEVSARHVPLPMSGVGSSHAPWDDDLDSVVPDDSISCVGSKSSRRSRRRH